MQEPWNEGAGCKVPRLFERQDKFFFIGFSIWDLSTAIAGSLHGTVHFVNGLQSFLQAMELASCGDRSKPCDPNTVSLDLPDRSTQGCRFSEKDHKQTPGDLPVFALPQDMRTNDPRHVPLHRPQAPRGLPGHGRRHGEPRGLHGA